jgi:hypothetical protein
VSEINSSIEDARRVVSEAEAFARRRAADQLPSLASLGADAVRTQFEREVSGAYLAGYRAACREVSEDLERQRDRFRRVGT